jgi:hypothetical protein
LDDRTAEQKDADEALEAAIRRVIELNEKWHGELLTDWLVVYACVDSSDYERSFYGACYPGGTLQSYRALGLMDLAAHQLRTGGWEDD